MRICQVTPGVFSIPPNGWGAIEKIIWNYKVELEKLGHQVDIKYPNELNVGDYDIVSVHMSNQAHMLHERGIKYIMHMHDHHVMLHDNILQDNKLALQRAVLGIVPAEHLLKLFNLPNVVYLSHGVDTDYFSYRSTTTEDHKLLCIAHNGILGNSTADRKGFSYAIQAAQLLDLPITIAGPKANNKQYFDANPDYFNYNKLNVLYDLDEKQLLDLYHSHTIFLHPSTFEAGHPNLTLLEALSTGLPVVGIYEGTKQLYGMEVVKRDTLSLTDGIKKVIKDYPRYKNSTAITRDRFNWKVIVNDLVTLYDKTLNKTMREQLISIYSNLKKNKNNTKLGIKINYNDGAFVEILGTGESNHNVEFWCDGDKIYNTTIKPGHWCRPSTKYFREWLIKVDDMNIPFTLENRKVLIVNESPALGDVVAWIPYVEEFRKKHNCSLTFASPWQNLFENNYKEIDFKPYSINRDGYDAIYYIGIFNGADANERHKRNWKTLRLQEVAADILGLEYKEIRPNIVVNDRGRPIKEKYAIITEWSTLKAKLWLHNTGWQDVVNYLNDNGYKVIIISKEKTNLKNVIDRSDRSIEDTINTIYHAEFGLGPSTGIGWLTWSFNKPYIVPSGYSEEFAEYHNQFRIINKQYCHGCFNDVKIPFDKHRNWDACPRNKNFICSSSITTQQVKDEIDKVIKYLKDGK